MAAAQPLMSDNDPLNSISSQQTPFSLPRTTYAANTDSNLATLFSEDNRFKQIETSQLCNAWKHSTDLLTEAARLLHSNDSLHPSIHSVVVAGSFGRMEGSRFSDFDFFVIAHDGAVQNREDEKSLTTAVWEKIKALPVEAPDSNGIFTRVVTPSIICDRNALGNLDYARHVFGLRMQLLTDSQPIYGAQALQQLQKDVIRWYCQPDYSPFSHSVLQYLCADLKRYFASYAIWHQYRYDKTYNDSWLLRQIKMHHSRLASYTALAISAMTIASTHHLQKNTFSEAAVATKLTEQLKYTPLERLILHWPPEHEAELKEYVKHYNRISELISDPKLRQLIINEHPDHVNDRRKGFASATTPEPVLTEIIDALDKLRALLGSRVIDTIQNAGTSTSACWAL